MASFIFYDLIFLVLFTLGVAIFLYTRKHNLKREGLLYLYRTSFGIKVINWTSKNFGPILRPMQYVVIASGYILMISMVWLALKFVYLYIKYPLAEQIKIPPLIPLIPYLPELFKIDFLPPFYFAYWIIIIAIIAIPHEFAHGIFAKLNNIKIHSTGFGFLGPFLAAFVEPDEKKMAKAPKFVQLSVLASGTFANVLTTIFFALILWLFFTSGYVASGINFNTYGTEVISISGITAVNGLQISSPERIQPNLKEGLNEISIQDKNYFIDPLSLEHSLDNNLDELVVFEDAPAINAQILSPIISIDNEQLESYDELRSILSEKAPGDEISLTYLSNEEEITTSLNLGDKDGNAYLGIGILQPPRTGISGYVYSQVEKVKSTSVYYESKFGDFGDFIYDLLWWTILIAASVALVNMLPVGIFDGGRFFYLTVLGITKSERISRKAFSFMTWLMIFLAVLIMVKWFFAVI